MKQWYETPEGMARLNYESMFIEEDYPNMQVQCCDDGYIRASGFLGPSNLSLRTMFIVAEFPATFPMGRPRVYAPDEVFPSNTPHIYPSSDYELCVEHGNFSPNDTMSTVLGWTLEWIALYDEFCNTEARW